MITKERQDRITQTAIREFAEALDKLETAEAHRPPNMRQNMREAIESQLEQLRELVTEYENLRSGRVQVLELNSLDELSDYL